MKYVIANLLVLSLCASLMIVPIWMHVSLHYVAKILLSVVSFFIAGYLTERVLSKFVNTIISKFND